MNVSVRVRVHVRAHVEKRGMGDKIVQEEGERAASLHARAAKKIKLN